MIALTTILSHKAMTGYPPTLGMSLWVGVCNEKHGHNATDKGH